MRTTRRQGVRQAMFRVQLALSRGAATVGGHGSSREVGIDGEEDDG